MIVRVGKLGKAVIVRARFLALVDRRVEIDEMPPGLAGRLHEDFDVALAVEGAGIAAGRVVVDDGVDVGGLAPAHAFEVDAEGGADRATRYVEGQRGRRNPERPVVLAGPGRDPERVRAAEVVR